VVLGGKASAAHPEMATYRAAGWADALRDAGLSPEAELMVPLHAYSIAEARSVIAETISRDRDIDGVFAVTDGSRSGRWRVCTTSVCGCPTTSSSSGSTTSGS